MKQTSACATVICANHFVQRVDTGIASAPRNQHWQSQDKDDDQDGAGIFHAVCSRKDKQVFANAVAFAVTASEIAAAGTDVNGMSDLHELSPPF